MKAKQILLLVLVIVFLASALVYVAIRAWDPINQYYSDGHLYLHGTISGTFFDYLTKGPQAPSPELERMNWRFVATDAHQTGQWLLIKPFEAKAIGSGPDASGWLRDAIGTAAVYLGNGIDVILRAGQRVLGDAMGFFVMDASASCGTLNDGSSCFWIGGTGSWTQTTHWSNSSGGVSCSCTPNGSHLIFFDASSGGGTATLNSASITMSELIMTGWTGTFALGANAFIVNGAVTSNGTFTLGGTLSMTTGSLTLNYGALFNANFSSGTLTAGTGTVNLGGGVAGSNPRFSPGGGMTFYNLTLAAPAGTDIINTANTLYVSRTLTISGGGLGGNNWSILLAGNAITVLNATAACSNTNIYSYDLTASGTQTWIGPTGGSCNILTHASSASGVVVTQGSAVSMFGAFTMSGSATNTTTWSTANFGLTVGSISIQQNKTLSAGSSTITISGSFNFSAGTFTYGTSTVVFAANGILTTPGVAGTAYLNNLTINAGVAVTLASHVSLGGSLVINATAAATPITGAYRLTLYGTTFTVGSGATTINSMVVWSLGAGTSTVPSLTYYSLDLGGRTYNFGGNITTTGEDSISTNSFRIFGSTVNTQNYTLNVGTGVNGRSIDVEGSASVLATGTSAVISNGRVIITDAAGYITSSAGGSWSIGGQWTNASISASWSFAAPITFNSATSQTMTFAAVTTEFSGAVTFDPNAAATPIFTVAGNLLKTAGLLTVRNTNAGGTATLTDVTNNKSITAVGATVGARGVLTMGSGTLTTSSSFNFSAGTFNYGTSTVIFTASATLSSPGTVDTTYLYKLTVNASVTLTISGHETIANLFTIGNNATVSGNYRIRINSGVSWGTGITTAFTLDWNNAGSIPASTYHALLVRASAALAGAVTTSANDDAGGSWSLYTTATLTTGGSAITVQGSSGLLISGANGVLVASTSTVSVTSVTIDNAAGYITSSGGTWTASGAWTNSSTSASWSFASPITFTSATGATITPGGMAGSEFVNATFTSSAATAQTFTLATRALKWSGTLTVSDGSSTTALATANLGLTGGAATVGNGGILTANASTVSVSNVTMTGGTNGTITLTSGAWTVSGNWDSSGAGSTFAATSSAVTMSGASKTVKILNVSNGFASLTVSGSVTFASAMKASGTFLVSGTVTTAGYAFTGGSLILSGGTLTATTSAMTFTDVTATSGIDVLSVTTGTIGVSGNWDTSGITTTLTLGTSSTVEMSGAGKTWKMYSAQFIPWLTFSGTATLQSNVIAKVLIVTGTLTKTSYSLLFNSLATGTIVDGAVTVTNISITTSTGTDQVTIPTFIVWNGGVEYKWTHTSTEAGSTITFMFSGQSNTLGWNVYKNGATTTFAYGIVSGGTFSFNMLGSDPTVDVIMATQCTTNCYWVGGTANYSNVNHWSATSGGFPGNLLPYNNSNVIVDANSGGSAFIISLTAEATFASLVMTNGFATLDTTSSNYGITTGLWGGTGSLTISGGAVFKANASTIILQGNFSDTITPLTTGATFWWWAGGGSTTTLPVAFLTINLGVTLTTSAIVTVYNTLTVNGTLTGSGKAVVTSSQVAPFVLGGSGSVSGLAEMDFNIASATLSLPGGAYPAITYLRPAASAQNLAITLTGNFSGAGTRLGIGFGDNLEATSLSLSAYSLSVGSLAIYDSGDYVVALSTTITLSGNWSSCSTSASWAVNSSTFILSGASVQTFDSGLSACGANTGTNNNFGPIIISGAGNKNFTTNFTSGDLTTSVAVHVVFTAAITWTMTGTTIQGAIGTTLTLESSAAAAWNLHALDPYIVAHYVAVSYSNASGGNPILAGDGTDMDNGNNTNWLFSFNPSANQDTYARQSQPNTIYGTLPLVNTGKLINGNDERRGFFAWNLTGGPIPSDTLAIDSAIVKLYKASNSVGYVNSPQWVMRQISIAWTQNNLTWNNQPAVQDANKSTINPLVTGTNGWYQWDVTNIYLSWASNGFSNNFGVRLTLDYTPTNDEYVNWNSSENTAPSTQPLLVVTTHAITPPPPPPKTPINYDVVGFIMVMMFFILMVAMVAFFWSRRQKQL